MTSKHALWALATLDDTCDLCDPLDQEINKASPSPLDNEPN